MKPTTVGQIVKFHTPLLGENPNQQYVVLELKIDGERDRADISPLGTNLPFPGINTVLISDLEVVQVSTDDLIGELVTIRKSDTSVISGKVLRSKDHLIDLSMVKESDGVSTNVNLTIVDNEGTEHEGCLIIL